MKNCVRTRFLENLFHRVVIWCLFFIVPVIHLPLGSFVSWDQKWVVLHLSTLMIVTYWLSGTKRAIALPRLERPLIKSLGAVSIVSLLVNIFFHRFHLSWLHLLERLSFLVLVVYFFDLYKEKREMFFSILRTPILLSLAFVLLKYCWDYFHHFGFYIVINQEVIVSSFGNINMLTQGLFLNLIILLLVIGRSKTHLLLVSFIFVCVFLISISGHSRSILLVQSLMILSLSFYVIMKFKKGRFFFIPLSLVLVGLFVHYLKKYAVDLGTRERLLRDSLDLITANPLGVGIGNFPFSILPYQLRSQGGLTEFLLTKSPHNEVLRFIAEDGCIFAGAIYSLALAILFMSSKIFAVDMRKRLFLGGIFLFYFVETLFQFPMENPYPFVGLSLLFGIAISNKGARSINLVAIAPMTFLLNLLMAFLFFSHFYLESDGRLFRSDIFLNNHLCRVSIDFWPLCIKASSEYSSQGNHEAAMALIQNARVNQPNNYLLFREEISVQWRKRDFKSACKSVREILESWGLRVKS